MKILSFFVIFFSLTFYGSCNDSVVYITSENHNQVLGSSDIVFTAFLIEWCPFSRLLKPIWLEASKLWLEKYPKSNVTFAIVDCIKEEDIRNKYDIMKFPTMKIFINGELSKKEYRGARNVEGLHKFLNNYLTPAFKEFLSTDQLKEKMDKTKRNIVSYLPKVTDTEYKNFKTISFILKNDCDFWYSRNYAVQHVSENSITFHDPHKNSETKYTGKLDDYDALKAWMSDKCIPSVREVTFENAEELAEEGKPFLVYFRDPKDKEGDKKFYHLVENELHELKNKVNPLFADGFKFSHPLKHLEKTSENLPILAIDSFQHMFLFPNMTKLHEPGQLKNFVLDLFSGKLHRDFHEMMDKKLFEFLQKVAEQQAMIGEGGGPAIEASTPPMEKPSPKTSIFKELKPSENRYSLNIKSEL
uniref:Thioredoxin domain-containing protein n=1 Tax=Parastrongyloides trichosuri TaxID=131310 RepID=A0A0N5A4P9_PARTI